MSEPRSNNPSGPLGIVYDMPFDDYHAVPALSASGMRDLARSAWHYRNRVETVPTKAMLNGTLAHCAQLEPGALSERYVVVPDEAPKRPTKAQWAAKKPSPESMLAMEWWTGFQKTVGTRLIVGPADYATTQQQLAALQAEPEIAKLFARGMGEVSAFWIDPSNGVYCKARVDWVHPIDDRSVKLVDLKTTVDESPDAFARSAARMGHHRQQAHYWRGFEIASGMEVVDFVFATVTSQPPVLAVAYHLVDEVMQQGEEEVAELTEFYAQCMKADHWPAYTPDQRMIDFPKWAKRSQEVEVSYVD
jgi:hypothetical protein